MLLLLWQLTSHPTNHRPDANCWNNLYPRPSSLSLKSTSHYHKWFFLYIDSEHPRLFRCVRPALASHQHAEISHLVPYSDRTLAQQSPRYYSKVHSQNGKDYIICLGRIGLILKFIDRKKSLIPWFFILDG